MIYVESPGGQSDWFPRYHGDDFPNVSADFSGFHLAATKGGRSDRAIVGPNFSVEFLPVDFELGTPTSVVGTGDILMLNSDNYNTMSPTSFSSTMTIDVTTMQIVAEAYQANVGVPVIPLGNGIALFAKWNYDGYRRDQYNERVSLVVRDKHLKPLHWYLPTKELTGDDFYAIIHDRYLWTETSPGNWQATRAFDPPKKPVTLKITDSRITFTAEGITRVFKSMN